jgi:hypothetical protein
VRVNQYLVKTLAHPLDVIVVVISTRIEIESQLIFAILFRETENAIDHLDVPMIRCMSIALHSHLTLAVPDPLIGSGGRAFTLSKRQTALYCTVLSPCAAHLFSHLHTRCGPVSV